MLTLQNFDSQLGTVIVQLGKEYYSKGYVAYTEETSDDIWTAQVDGSETYTVEVTLKNKNEITDYSCDCPYDGGTCKHAAAVFFTLRSLVANIKMEDAPTKKAKKDVFETLLQSVSVKEFQDFIREQASKNKNFKTTFELFFADKDTRINVEEKYAGLVQQLIRKHSDRGFIDYRASITLAREVDGILATGNSYAQKNNFKDAFALAKAVLRPMMEVQENCDDSNGSMAGCIDGAIQLLENIASTNTAAIDLKEQLLKFLQTELNDKLYFDYGNFAYDMFTIFQNLAVQLNQPKTFLNFIEAQTPKLSGQYDSYKREFFQKCKIEFLQLTGKGEEAAQLVEQNMDIVDIRMGEMEKAISKKDFGLAKKIIAGGIKIAEGKNHPGTVDQWKKELLRIAMLEKDVVAIRLYTKYFAFDRTFSSEYYNQWKASFNSEEWLPEIEKHIETTIQKITKEWQLNNSKSWRPTVQPPLLHDLAPIFIQEKCWERLLHLVQQANTLNATLQYHPWLVKQYPQQLLDIYVPTLEQYGNETNDRSQYADLVDKMNKVIKDIPEGKSRIMNVAKRLREKFSNKPRRPAMMEELDKILKIQ